MIYYMIVRLLHSGGTHAVEYDGTRPMIYHDSADAELAIAKLRKRRPGEKFRIITDKVR